MDAEAVGQSLPGETRGAVVVFVVFFTPWIFTETGLVTHECEACGACGALATVVVTGGASGWTVCAVANFGECFLSIAA